MAGMDNSADLYLALDIDSVYTDFIVFKSDNLLFSRSIAIKLPGKDEEWAKQAKKDLGEQRYRQEILCTFLGSTNTVIDANVLDVIVGGWKDPLLKEIEDKLFIYEKPEDGYIYILGVDSGKGTGNHCYCIYCLWDWQDVGTWII